MSEFQDDSKTSLEYIEYEKYPSREIEFIGGIDREIELQNQKAKLKIKRTKNGILFQSQGLVVAFNGGGDIAENDPVFNESAELAKQIVDHGGLILNGGRNSGIMEATSRDADRHSLGINFPEQIKLGVINRHGKNIVADSVTTRLNMLTIYPPIVVVYGGEVGTLHELVNSFVAIKNEKYGMPAAPKLLVHKSWQKILENLRDGRVLKPEYFSVLNFFEKPEEALRIILK